MGSTGSVGSNFSTSGSFDIGSGGPQLSPEVQAAALQLDPKDRAMLLLADRIESGLLSGRDVSRDTEALANLMGPGSGAQEALADPQQALLISQMLKQRFMTQASGGSGSVEGSAYPTQTVSAQGSGSTAYTDAFMADPSSSIFDLSSEALLAEATAAQSPAGGATSAGGTDPRAAAAMLDPKDRAQLLLAVQVQEELGSGSESPSFASLVQLADPGLREELQSLTPEQQAQYAQLLQQQMMQRAQQNGGAPASEFTRRAGGTVSV